MENDRNEAFLLALINKKNEEIRELEQKNRLLSSKYQTIADSTSWKITKPVRYMLDYIKKRFRKRRRNSKSLVNDKITNIVGLDNIIADDRNLVDRINEVTIDVIVPIFNAYDFTRRCLDSVYRNTDVNYNLYLLNDCSSDTRIVDLLDNISQLPKPPHLRELVIIHSKENQGFIKNVNYGLSISENDVVLLNTDTEVPPYWLSRLVMPALVDQKIASVTPCSNSATICSFPNFVQDNELPYNLNVEEIDYIFRKYGPLTTLDIPTGVGFCMYMRRDCILKYGVLDTIYGMGYGEENDWCMRVRQYGYKNVMIYNLFVYHKHGVSFGEKKDKKKIERIKENTKILLSRYPYYNSLVHDFIKRDPGNHMRQFLWNVLCAYYNPLEHGVLFVNHTLGGGSEKYQKDLISNLENNTRCYIMRCKKGRIILQDKDNTVFFELEIANFQQTMFDRILKILNIDLIYINQFVGYPLNEITKLIMNSGVKYVYFIHDFFCVCPSYNLLREGEYCQNCSDITECEGCLKDKKISQLKITEHRRIFYNLFKNADKIYCPSENTKLIVNEYYHDIKIIVKEHKINYNIVNTFDSSFVNDVEMNVAVLGAIRENKGLGVLNELVSLVDKGDCPINLKIIGYSKNMNKGFVSKNKRVLATGRYERNEVSHILEKYRINLVLILSICPETFSYTTSEALLSGYPVASFKLGAPYDRIRKYDCGWGIDNISAKSVYELLTRLYNDRNEILNKQKNCKNLPN